MVLSLGIYVVLSFQKALSAFKLTDSPSNTLERDYCQQNVFLQEEVKQRDIVWNHRRSTTDLGWASRSLCTRSTNTLSADVSPLNKVGKYMATGAGMSLLTDHDILSHSGNL